jgi:hypothetical protein
MSAYFGISRELFADLMSSWQSCTGQSTLLVSNALSLSMGIAILLPQQLLDSLKTFQKIKSSMCQDQKEA